MPIEQYTYWSVTINNPDENDYLIMRNPNSKYIRECVWTPEVGAETGTPHIQAWVRLQRNQSLSFVNKLYPRAHVKPTDKDMYNENSHQYAQKNDETTAGNHHIILNDPLPANDTLLYKVLETSFENLLKNDDDLKDYYDHEGLKHVVGMITLKQLHTDWVERDMVMEKSGLEKIFISPAYEKMKSRYWREILLRLFKHKEEEDARSTSGYSKTSTKETQTENGGEDEDHEDSDSTEDEGQSESGSSRSSQEDACSEY